MKTDAIVNNIKHLYILGISCFYHDSAAALICDGEIIAAAQEERFTRTRHDSSFPSHAIAYCLQEAGISMDQLSTIVYYEKPFLKFERILENYLENAPKGFVTYLKTLPMWLGEKLWIPSIIRRELGWSGLIAFERHHYSHAAAAFFSSPFESAAILVVDGVGEWSTVSWGVGKGNHLELKGEMQFPHSLGLLYSAFTYYLGFRVNSGEYKVMGLAAYGKPIYENLIRAHLIDIKSDGTFELNMKYFNFHTGLTMTNEKFHALFGSQPRVPESDIREVDMDIAASIQKVTEDVMCRLAKDIRAKTGERNLCFAGGVALNCVAHSKILGMGIYDSVWIPPAPDDAGGAVGAALSYWNTQKEAQVHVEKDENVFSGALLGPSYTDTQVRKFLQERNVSFFQGGEEEVHTKIAEYLDKGFVVGVFRGRMEFGARALGSRSILADPRSPHSQQRVNQKIKFRESFRPLAPAVLSDHCAEYFESAPGQEFPYMNVTLGIKKKHRVTLRAEEESVRGLAMLNIVRSDIPAVTHVDYSARVQTVSPEIHPRFYKLIDAFYRRTGCPLVANTSFNVRGEPIVCSLEDALNCFLKTDIDILVMENCIVEKTAAQV